jgi:hypothetical protein
MKGFKFCLHKAYFDRGFGLLNYLKYPLVLLGIVIPNVKWIILISFLYAFACYFLGWWWINSGFMDAETEVGNIYNPFVREMRKSLHRNT